MAESTRYRTLEDQLKKQEGCLQEVVESMADVQAACQRRFQDELEQKSSRLEALVGSLNQRFDSIEQKFNSLLNTMMKEKGCSEPESRISEPLLPTPLPHTKLRHQNGAQLAPPEGRSKYFNPILPKLEMPMFATEFSDLLCERFASKASRDVVEEFNKLQQKRIVEEYEEKFEELKTLMLLRNPKLDELNFVSGFVSGLKEEIRPMVKMFKPQTLAKAFEVAELQECGDKFGAGHCCKPGNLNSIDLEEGNDTDFEDAEGEQDESTGRVGKLAEVSLNALNGAMSSKSIILLGNMGGLPIKILVDTGASNSFIHFGLARSLYLPSQEVTPFTVTLADGTDITSGAVCPSVKWLIQDYQFQFDLKVMDLGNWDIILGVDWMYQFSPITFDFHSLNIALSSSGSLLHLQGLINQPLMELVRGRSGTATVLASIRPERELDHQITLKPGAEPFKLKPYRYPHAHKTEIEMQVAEMLSSGIVTHSSSPFASPVLLVKKKDNSWRLCVDYRKLNELTIKDRFPIPNIDELLNELHGTKYMSKLDLRAGYHQVRVKAMDTHKIAFQTHHGHFEFLVMPFGLTNTPAIVQALMNRIFQPYMRKFMLVFFDDILVYGPTLELHMQYPQIVLGVLADNQLFCKRSKCSFAQTSVEYLGHVISEKGVSMDKSKIECILSWLSPETVKELRGFLGLTGYYRRFIKGYGVISKPLTQLLKKDGFAWNFEAHIAFEDLKKAMTTAPVLSMPNFEIPFIIETDACGMATGAVLMRQGHPIAFLSKALANQNLGMSVY
nr:uncharacterized protein LOC113696870 [Coffea arabica]